MPLEDIPTMNRSVSYDNNSKVASSRTCEVGKDTSFRFCSDIGQYTLEKGKRILRTYERVSVSLSLMAVSDKFINYSSWIIEI